METTYRIILDSATLHKIDSMKYNLEHLAQFNFVLLCVILVVLLFHVISKK